MKASSGTLINQVWRVLSLALSLTVLGCDGRGPETSTETGNPPVIDTRLVSLKTKPDGAVLIGELGSVDPPTGVVTAVELRSGDLYQAPVQADGSFRIPVSSAEGLYYVTVGDSVNLVDVLMEAAKHPDSIVVLGNVSIEDTVASLGLSCLAEGLRAEGALQDAFAEASRSCSVDADCVLVSYDTVCAPSCAYSVVNQEGQKALEAVKAELAGASCPAHEAGECSTTMPTCPDGELVPKCRTGTCYGESADLEQQCGGPSVALTWTTYSSEAPASDSPTYRYTGLDYGGLERLEPDGTRCVSVLTKCGSEGAEHDIAMRAAVADADVQTAILSGGAQFDGDATVSRMQIDVQVLGKEPVRIDIPLCTSCGVPEGLHELADVLQRVQTEKDPCTAASSSL